MLIKVEKLAIRDEETTFSGRIVLNIITLRILTRCHSKFFSTVQYVDRAKLYIIQSQFDQTKQCPAG